MSHENMNTKLAVITGASSGLGRATAHEFAKHGYDLVLIARRVEELVATAEECKAFGVQAIVKPADVSDENAIQKITEDIRRSYGVADVWVNAAGVFAAGSVEDVPLKDMKRVMDINFFGIVNGSRAALTHFREGGAGTLINIASGIGEAPLPYLGIYNASKAAVKAFDDSLRMELRLEGLHDTIHVSTVYPSVTDTHIYQNGADYTGQRIVAPPPVFDPETIARHIYRLVDQPKRDLLSTSSTKSIIALRSFAPALYERVIVAYAKRFLISRDKAEATTGNLYEPINRHRGMRGGWKRGNVSGEAVDAASLVVGVAGVLMLAGVAYSIVSKRLSQR